MTEEQERLIELVEAAILLGNATVPDLRAARTIAEAARDRDEEIHSGDDIDLVVGALDFAASNDSAIEVLTLVTRLRIAQGWTAARTTRQPEDEEA